MSRATVVLPLPGGPQKIIEPSDGAASRRVSAPFGPVRCSWPETSASVIGRSRSASGAGGGSGLGSRPSRRLMALCPARDGSAVQPGRAPACRLAASRVAHCPPFHSKPKSRLMSSFALPYAPSETLGLHSGTARAAHRNHGASGRGEEGAGRLHADRPPRQDRLSPIGRRARARRPADDATTRSSASIR